MNALTQEWNHLTPIYVAIVVSVAVTDVVADAVVDAVGAAVDAVGALEIADDAKNVCILKL